MVVSLDYEQMYAELNTGKGLFESFQLCMDLLWWNQTSDH